MPIYTYECNDCGRKEDYLLSMGQAPYECSNCEGESLTRVVEGFSAHGGKMADSGIHNRPEELIPREAVPMIGLKVSGIGSKITDVSLVKGTGVLCDVVSPQDN